MSFKIQYLQDLMDSINSKYPNSLVMPAVFFESDDK